MMKWRVRRDSNCGIIEHEDIRRSLEVLDSVLAEFDDCLESWDTHAYYPSSDSCKILESSDLYRNGFPSSNGERFKLENFSTEDTTSHNFPDDIQDQNRVGSPPPIPKRSPATRLSEHNHSVFTFLCDSASLGSSGDLSSDSHVTQSQISSLLSARNNDDVPKYDNCSNCGSGLKRSTPAMDQDQEKDSGSVSSPFLQRKQMIEAKIAEASPKSPILIRSYGSSFHHKNAIVNSSFETAMPKDSVPLPQTEYLPEDGPNSFSGQHHDNCTCKEKIHRLNEKFSETRKLLKLNKIKGLDLKPPSFVPPPPVPLPNRRHFSDSQLSETSSLAGRTTSELNYSADVSALDCESISKEGSSRFISYNSEDFGGSCSSLLCNRCSSSLSVPLSETIEDLPKLLPTDALNRPQLGLSYSLEEDLSPGVKEIKTSTPKRDFSSPKLFRTKESNLSTFSHSANSLGYVSSQSDLELNNLSTVPDKVPVSSFKSMTLPNGLDRSPFYSPEEDNNSVFYKVCSTRELNDYNDNRLPAKPPHLASIELRSSSAPPPPEKEKPKSKHFRVFSRKSKKDKHKNGGTQ